MQQKLFNLPILKKCSKCKVEKLATKVFFYWHSSNNDFSTHCKSCIAAQAKQHHAEHPEQNKMRCKKYYSEHREQFLIQCKKYREEHREEHKIQKRKYRSKHSEEVKARQRKWYVEHFEQISNQSKKWHEEHPEQIRKSQAKHVKRKLAKFANLFDLSKSDMRMAKTIWSAQVRQDKRCAICTRKAIHAHHILHASKYPNLSLNPNNGIPLCRDHHVEVHLFDPYVNLIKKGAYT